jgi:hypothetical protein
MLKFFKNLFFGSTSNEDLFLKPNIEKIIQKIRRIEKASHIESGRRIHEFDNGFLPSGCNVILPYTIG